MTTEIEIHHDDECDMMRQLEALMEKLLDSNFDWADHELMDGTYVVNDITFTVKQHEEERE